MGKEEEDENYRPYDTLKAIGFTKDEAKGFLTNIEQTAAAQLPPEPKKAPEIEIKFQAQRAELRRRRLKNLLLIVWGYAFAVWVYVIAIQFFHPDWIYAPFATWLPIRTDYVGEGAFVASFIIITAITMWNTETQHPNPTTRYKPTHPENPRPQRQTLTTVADGRVLFRLISLSRQSTKSSSLPR